METACQSSQGLQAIASTENSGFAGIADERRILYSSTPKWITLRVVCIWKLFGKVCGCKGDWSMASFAEDRLPQSETVGLTSLVRLKWRC